MNKVSIEKLYDKKIFSIEGNMGAGKTRIISLLQKDFDDVLLVEEPVSEWQNIHGHNILEKKFENPDVRYYACVVDKNRAGAKPTIVFRLNLAYNVWEELGYLRLKQNKK